MRYLKESNVSLTEEQINEAVNNSLKKAGRNELTSYLRFLPNVATSEEEAERLLTDNSYGFDDNIAVRVKQTKLVPPEMTEKHKSARASFESALKALEALQTKMCLADHTSKYATCKKCGSRIAIAYMTARNNCPVCENDMRNETMRKRIDNAQKKVEATKQAYEKEEMKYSQRLAKGPTKKTEHFWLIQVDESE